ncbi:MAG: hypothetical protein IT161_13385 [Bryobacterales bacterium]|nr:hypothetical protein [Bryobacterales bacterium]
MSEYEDDGGISVEAGREHSPDGQPGAQHGGSPGETALRAEPDGIAGAPKETPVGARRKDRRGDRLRDGSGVSDVADTLGELAMSNGTQENNMPLGLDVGTSRIVVARSTDRAHESQYESQLNAFITLPYSKLAASLLEREGVFHEVYGDELVVTGNDAQRFAEVFHVETRRPMQRGVLNPKEPHSLRVLRGIITRLAGKAGGQNRKVFFSIPSPVGEDESAISYHEASITQILADLGFEGHPIREGLAVVFGEMSSSNFTGIGISCGSGLCNICLAVLSVPVFNFAIPKAGDFIDSQAAAVTGELATRMRVMKEMNFAVNGLGGDRVQNALTVYYDDVIHTLANSLRTTISSTQRLPKLDQSIPIVLSGGTALPKGFLKRFTTALRADDFPIKISEVRVAADPLNSTARGALMAALC